LLLVAPSERKREYVMNRFRISNFLWNSCPQAHRKVMVKNARCHLCD
jgi:hypothetical protein